MLVVGLHSTLCNNDNPHITPSDSEYRDRLELKSTTDRTLGVGVIQSEGILLILTAATMMKAIVDVDNVLAFDSQYV